ncbi:FUSC family protein [Photobacterium rosenbergii]|uniref:FUSC family protein n=1 Tax=Photobacterium rosenbergii TaxID=294936 RepID=A0ABU3ZEV9_9GAMM|nr:FUSC family protein [Photobacterium rosenbergii]MDV5168563.1 FUSC family protein [Photobacterium rosenbergii]
MNKNLEMNLHKPISKLESMIFNHYRVVHGIRVSLAFIVTMLGINYFQLPEGSWILTTIVVIMGSISYLGNVQVKAINRLIGTALGAFFGVIALLISHWSLSLMYIWCAVAMFICGYFALGKRAYAGLVIGITLSVVIGVAEQNLSLALLRVQDVAAGCILAVFYCFIYPQRAYIHWRLRITNILRNFAKVHCISHSRNIIEQPNIVSYQHNVMKDVMALSNLIAPSVRESKLSNQLLDSIQVKLRNIVYSLELLNSTFWSDHDSHLNMLWSDSLLECHQAIEQEFRCLANMMETGNVDGSRLKIEKAINTFKNHNSEFSVEKSSVNGYFWLNINLLEDLSTLRKLLMLSLHLSQDN